MSQAANEQNAPRLSVVGSSEKRVAIQSYNAETGKWNISYNGKVYSKFAEKAWGKNLFKKSQKLRKLGVTELRVEGEENVTAMSNVMPEPEVVQSRFSINERFGFIDELVGMVRDGATPSMMVTGQGGLGKSYTVLQNVKDLQENKDFVVIKGFSTAKALFRLLQMENGKLFIFDDCDSVLKDPASQNLLKAALDSFGKRRITWNAESNDDLERSFDFTGKVIFISNMPFNKIPQALVSRSYTIDLSMTQADKIERMKEILPQLVEGEVTMKEKQDAMDFVEENAENIADLNFRTLIKVAKIRKGAKGDWRKMAEYMTMEQG